MADLKVSQLTALAATPASGDLVSIVDVSDTTMAASGTNKKLTAAYLALTDGNVTKFTGGGTVAIPATDTMAVLGQNQTFTGSMTIDGAATGQLLVKSSVTAASTYGITADSPSGASAGWRNFRWSNNSTLMGYITATAADNNMIFQAFDGGTSVGSYIQLARNNNGSTPAAGFIMMADLNGTVRRVWPDASGNLRIHTANPTNANDTAGTVVGTQTSSLDAKNVVGEPVSPEEALANVVAAAQEAVKRFVYKSGAYGGEEFSGVVVDYAPRYGMDRDADHPAGKSLNVITVIGDLLLAVQALATRVEELERK